MRHTLHLAPRLPVALIALSLAACQPPDASALFNQVEVFPVDDAATTNARYIQAIDGANESLHIALPAGDDPAVGDAIARAWDRGVQVEVITDIDLASTPAVTTLLDAGVPTTLADDAVAYFDFNINENVSFPSEDCVMSHSFLVADEMSVVTGSHWGHVDDGSPQRELVYQMRGEDLIIDLLLEHNQIFGGTDATTTTAYDANAKSITDFRWMYRTTTGVDLELWFGPQERLTKRVIDAIYGARSSVRVLTSDFFNEGVALALQDKAKWGVDVSFVVDDSFDTALSQNQDLLELSPDVTWNRVPYDDPPTLILIDYQADPDGYRSRAKAMMLSHGLVSGPRLVRRDPVVSDQLIDGTMWVLGSSDAELPPELLQLMATFDEHFAESEEL